MSSELDSAELIEATIQFKQEVIHSQRHSYTSDECPLPMAIGLLVEMSSSKFRNRRFAN